jgi:hypothetical protein
MAKREAQASSEVPIDGTPAALSGLGERLRHFLRAPLGTARNSARERLYADIGGAVIGLGGAVALIELML